MTIAARDFAGGDEDRMTSANGTFETSRDVRCLVAVGGKPDVANVVQ